MYEAKMRYSRTWMWWVMAPMAESIIMFTMIMKMQEWVWESVSK
jgi:hypothetical protein